MKNGDIIVIDSVRELLDDKQQTVIGRVITDKAGNETKIKKGQGGKLAERWEWLDGASGKAIKLTVGEFKGYPYVAGFEVVEDVFVAQATEKVQAQAKGTREDSIEAQTSQKGGIEVLKALIDMGKLNEAELEECMEYAMASVRWGMGRVNLPSVIVTKIEEANFETNKADKGNQETQSKPTARQDSGEPKTVGEFLTWLTNHDIKAPRAWLEVEYKVSNTEVLTIEKCSELYKTIQKDKGW